MKGSYGAVQYDSCQNEISSPPSVVFQKNSGKWWKSEGTDAGAANRDARGQGSLCLEVIPDTNHGRQVDKTEADTWKCSICKLIAKRH